MGGESDDTLPFLFINNHMKSFKEILEEAKQINYSIEKTLVCPSAKKALDC